MEQAETNRTALLPYDDFQVLVCILLPYAKGVPDTVTKLFERDAILKTIEALYQHTPEGKTSGEQPLLLNEGELSVVLKALTSFIENIACFFPPYAEREEIIQSCEKLHLYVSTLFAPLQAPTSEGKA